MSGGNRRVVLNLNERVVSPDHNRHQQVAMRDRAEHLKYLLDVSPMGWDYSGALVTYLTTVSTPLRADVLEGLVVMPQVGTTSLFVLPGALGVFDPDGQAGSSDPNPPSADDSSYKIVVDEGISALGVLVIGANAAGTTRIDIIECQRRETVTGVAARDIFNPATGAYVATPVNKVSEGQLNYRVRAGVAGAGYPGNVQGWLPLAVASVPTGTVTTDTVTFWDVRPLVTDRSFQPGRAAHTVMPAVESCRLYADAFSAAPAVRVGGHFMGHTVGGYRTGGTMHKGTPTAAMGGGDVAYVDIHNAENQDPVGFAPAGAGLWHLWLCFPYSRPRWVRYNETPIGGKRYPYSCRGIPVVSSVGPAYNPTSLLAGSLHLPLSTGLDPASATAVTDAVCVASGGCTAGTPTGFVADGDWLFPTSRPTPILPLAGGSLSYDEYHLVAGVNYPGNARALRVLCQAHLANATPFGASMELHLLHIASANVIAIPWHQETICIPIGGVLDAAWTLDISIVNPSATPGLSVNTNFRLYWSIGAGPVKSLEQCTVLGWRIEG